MFQEIDIVKMSGDINSALVLTVHVSGRSLIIILQLVKGSHTSHTIISAIETIEIFEIVRAEANTSIDEGFAEIEEFFSVGMTIHVFHNNIHGVELVVYGVLDANIWCIRFFYAMVVKRRLDKYRVRLNSRTLLGM
uniref:Uncharacterized protein n=1 Tax=Lactuca sativa TaxID=4236 RepID=A0A9R1VPR3_LACSA|nr:hypothetical protein LSAT_V11C400173690 [Lactuca sativa]